MSLAPTTPEQLQAWLNSRENQHLEFKTALNRFDFEQLVKYCCALANEGGGEMVLGVTPDFPRRVVGTAAFVPKERTESGLMERLHIRINAEELNWQGKRALIFHVPARPVGMPIQYQGAYWMRRGEELTPMLPDMLKRIFGENVSDFSATICSGARLSSLDEMAIKKLRERWHRKSGRADLLTMPVEQLLTDAELLVEGGLTYAALVLLGSHEALGRFLAQSEVVFEYRSTDASIPYQDRREFRQGFFTFDDELWQTINLRNDKQHFRDGLFVWDIATFNESVVREGILNAVSHRDYRLGGSIFVRQFPRKLEIESPGGFPEGINADNILWQHTPRNRRIAEVLGKCGLVERSGQGVKVMFAESIRESKSRPDFAGSDEYRVLLIINGEIQDVRFLRFLERVGEQILKSFSVEHMLVLDMLRAGAAIPERLRPLLRQLRELGLVEAIGHGRGARYFLAKKLYVVIGDRAGYTKKRGLDRETNKALLLKHLEHYKTEGSQLRDLMKVLPSLSRGQVQSLMRELRREGRAHAVGVTSAGRWYAGTPAGELALECKPSTGSNQGQ